MEEKTKKKAIVGTAVAIIIILLLLFAMSKYVGDNGNGSDDGTKYSLVYAKETSDGIVYDQNKIWATEGTEIILEPADEFWTPAPGTAFVGISDKQNGDGLQMGIGDTFTMPNHDVILYLLYADMIYNVSYHSNTTAPETAPEGKFLYGETFRAQSCMFDAPRGYEFKEWNTSSYGRGDVIKGGQTVTVTKSITLYAVWERVTVEPMYFTVTYVADVDGMVPIEGNKKANDTFYVASASTLVPPTGKAFAGWSMGGDVYQPGDKVKMPSANIEFTATWYTPEPGEVGYEPDLKSAYMRVNVSLPYVNLTGNVTGFHWEVYLDGEFFYESRLVGPNVTMIQAWWFDNNLPTHDFRIVVHAILDPSNGARTTTYILEHEGEFVPNEMVIVDSSITNPTDIRWTVVL